MKKNDYLALGATLFIPASHKRLEEIVSSNRYPDLKSLVIDFEDGLEKSDFEFAMKRIDAILGSITTKRVMVFMRARDVEHLSELLKLHNIENITGFVLAKFSLTNAVDYLDLLQNTKLFNNA
ncbi:MAG: HpcH/HpaI aldolase/citrate lyase family protein [Sulfurimonas sp.]|nr:HpcH/HpaI aldolase/citrate lyase family protein [Sulfurimonas sp.]